MKLVAEIQIKDNYDGNVNELGRGGGPLSLGSEVVGSDPAITHSFLSEPDSLNSIWCERNWSLAALALMSYIILFKGRVRLCLQFTDPYWQHTFKFSRFALAEIRV